jgi:hypothetical protein
MAPLEHGRDASALQLHLKDPESSCADLTPCLEHLQSTTSPYPLLPLSPSILSHTFSQNPTNPTIAGVSSISKVFVVVGF